MTRQKNWTIIALLTLAAPFLGGAVSVPTAGIWLVLAALLVLLFPMGGAVSPRIAILVSAWILWWLAAYLPTSWFPASGWRQQLESLGAVFAGTRTVQPWMTLEAWLLAAGGAGWMLFLLGTAPTPSQRHGMLRWYLGGLACLSVLSFLVYIGHVKVPFWPDEVFFGPFPNRNQTGDLMASGGVVLLALVWNEFKSGKLRGFLWTGCLLVVFAGLLATTSRAGAALFFAGCSVWLGWQFLGASSGRQRGRMVLLICGLVLLMVLFLVWGGGALDRVMAVRGEGVGGWLGGRIQIQKNALHLILSEPLFGVGLGNFEPVFEFYRGTLANEDRPLHPESDWLWLAAEGGLPLLVFSFFLAAYLLGGAWPFHAGTDRRLRSACWVAACMVVLHGFVDVSLHRLGTAIPAIFFLWLSRPGLRHAMEALPASKWRRAGAAGLLLLAGLFCLLQWAGLMERGSWVAGQKEESAVVALKEKNYGQARKAAEEVLVSEPLAWRAYFIRAQAEVFSGQDWARALNDFRIARLLEQGSHVPPYIEGLVWLGRYPDGVLEAWREAVKRRQGSRCELFANIVSLSERDPYVSEGLRRWAAQDPEWELFVLPTAPDVDFERILQRILRDPGQVRGLGEQGRRRLFAAWKQRLGAQGFLEQISGYPEWREYGWFWVAEALAETGDFKGAAQELRGKLEKPQFPDLALGQEDESRARRLLRYDSTDPGAVYVVVRCQQREGNTEAALQALGPLLASQGHPAYFDYLAGEIYYARSEWEAAYGAWKIYASR